MAVTAPVKVPRAEAVAGAAPQQRKALPAEFGEERRKSGNYKRREAGDRGEEEQFHRLRES
jgi:hypothetical protein